MKVTRIYVKLACGGVGYSPILYRYGRKYYQVLGDRDIGNRQKLITLLVQMPDYEAPPQSYALWLKHRNDNIVTAGEFLKIIKA